MRRAPLFVRSARRKPAAPAFAGRWQRAARIQALALVVIILVAVAAVATSIARAPRGIVVAPVVLHEGVPRPAQDATVQFHASTLALRERAQASDDLAQPGDVAWPPLELDTASGPMVSALRALRRTLVLEGPHVSVDVFALPDHLEIVVRQHPGGATIRSRVPQGAAALDRALAEGSEDLLLLTTPLAAAALLVQDPRGLADASRLDEMLTMLARDPEATRDPRAALLRGIEAAARGRCDEALGLYDSVIAARPSSPRAYVLAADCHARLGNRDRALERLARATQQADEAPLALSLAGQAYQRIGDAERGLALLRVAQVRNAELPGNAIAIGEALLALHRPAEAVAWLTAHAATDNLHARWRGALGIAQVRSGSGPAAQASAAALRTLDPASLEATRIEAELAAAMKAWPQALARFGALRLFAPNDGAARAGEGHALLGLRRPAEAISAYRGCAEVSPWRAECRLGLGIALREADQAEAALVPLAEAAVLDALDPRIPFETARTLRALLRRDEAAAHSAHADALAQRLAQRLTLP
jgi:tetratricopeptide (TPR) repeat protein